jgi:hypothetical protein
MNRSKFYIYALPLALLLVIVIIAVCVKCIGGAVPMTLEDQWDYYNNYVGKVNDRHYDIMFYRTVNNGPEALNARTVNSLNITSSPGCQGHILILNDINGSLFLSDEDLTAIAGLLKDHGYRIVYLGTSKFQWLVEAGIISSIPPEGTKSVITWYDSSNIQNTRNGIADDTIDLPQLVEQSIRPEQVPVYTLIMELGLRDIYWT